MTEKPVVLYRGPFAPALQAELAAIAPGVVLRHFDKDQDMERAVAEADIAAGNLSPAGLRSARRLKWLHCWAAGPDHQLFPELVESPVVLTCSKGNGAIPLAEHAMLLMSMLNRNAMRWIRAQRARKWDAFRHGELNGLTCGIIGMGNAGTDLALKAKAFHMRVVGLRRSDQPAPNFDRIYPRRDLHALLAESDFVVVTAPLTAETKDMLGEAEFRAMKHSAFFVCISRGGIANDDALLKALHEGWIAGAGLDAHAVEPLPPDSPFWTAPNTIVTPHGGAVTPNTPVRGFYIFAENLRRYLAGEPLVNVVDKQRGY
jgi:phosphoglycerate dehydrogenase-like enzyme